MHRALILIVAACGSSHTKSDAGGDAAFSGDAPGDALGTNLGTVSGVADAACPSGAPPGATCKKLTVSGCPQIESEAIDATVAIVAATGTTRGTIVHFSGGGGEGFETTGAPAYQTAGFLQVFVSWATDWEQTQSLGIEAAGCRPSTILAWAFAEPTLHAGSRTLGFCGQGFSGGSGQLGYALAHYGMSAYLDYVNELSGPPFARIDLGCDFSQPATAMVCGATDTMRLPVANLNKWENTTTCGSTTPSAADVAKWMADSISIGGVYNYPDTDVEYYDCTNQSTAVTAMAQIYYQQVFEGEGQVSALASYHCYTMADGCQGEALGSGAGAAANAMIAGCTPRHQ